MDDFKRMMEMEGVRPLSGPNAAPRRSRTHRQDARPEQPLPLPPVASGYAWVTGPRARVAMETALERLTAEGHNGQRGWINGIRQDGTATVIGANASIASILSTADRMSLRLIIVGGEGWTAILHPQMGVATLDPDPKGEA